MNSSSLSNVDDEIDVCIVVIITSTWNLDVTIGHPDVFGVDPQVFGSSHDGELDGTFVAKGLVSPFTNGSDLLDSCDTIVGDENLWCRGKKVCVRFEKSQKRGGGWRVEGMRCRGTWTDLGYNGVTAMCLDKVGDFARLGDFESVGTCQGRRRRNSNR